MRMKEIELIRGVFFQAEDGIRDLVRSRGLGDVYKRQAGPGSNASSSAQDGVWLDLGSRNEELVKLLGFSSCLLYTSDAADERSSVDLGGRRIIKKKKEEESIDAPRYMQ